MREFKNLQLVLKEGVAGPEGEMVGEVAVRYGAFGNAILEFVIIGLSAFVVVKAMNRVIRRRERSS